MQVIIHKIITQYALGFSAAHINHPTIFLQQCSIGTRSLVHEDALALLSHPLSGSREPYCHPIQQPLWHPGSLAPEAPKSQWLGFQQAKKGLGVRHLVNCLISLPCAFAPAVLFNESKASALIKALHPFPVIPPLRSDLCFFMYRNKSNKMHAAPKDALES